MKKEVIFITGLSRIYEGNKYMFAYDVGSYLKNPNFYKFSKFA